MQLLGIVAGARYHQVIVFAEADQCPRRCIAGVTDPKYRNLRAKITSRDRVATGITFDINVIRVKSEIDTNFLPSPRIRHISNAIDLTDRPVADMLMSRLGASDAPSLCRLAEGRYRTC
eukprot:COSAG02_NODE_1588_length_11795_cov_1295.418348_1_plen_119_part_00